MSGERVTRETTLQALASRPTSPGRDAHAQLCEQRREALEASEFDIAGDLLGTLERHDPHSDSTKKWRRRFAQAQARPLLNKVCRPDDRVRAGSVDEVVLPLKPVHRAILGHIDGTLTALELFEIAGLSPMEFAEGLRDLALFGAVEFDRRPPTSKPPSRRSTS